MSVTGTIYKSDADRPRKTDCKKACYDVGEAIIWHPTVALRMQSAMHVGRLGTYPKYAGQKIQRSLKKISSQMSRMSSYTEWEHEICILSQWM